MTIHTWTGDHQATVVVENGSNRVVKVLLIHGGDERDITGALEDETLAEIESQLLALGVTGGLDYDGDVEHSTGEPDDVDEATRRMEEDRMRESSE